MDYHNCNCRVATQYTIRQEGMKVEVDFSFTNDEQSRVICAEIVMYLMTRHQMASSDAHNYVKLQWSGQPFSGEDDDRYHWLAENWADHIYQYHDYLFGKSR